MDCLPAEIAKLIARKLTGAMVALSFCKRLTQPIQERVHPAYEYWGREDPTQGPNCKVSWVEATNRFARIMAGQIRDKGCPKALCLKRPTNAVSFLVSSVLFSLFSSCFLFFCIVFPTAVTQLGKFSGRGLGVLVPRSSA